MRKTSGEHHRQVITNASQVIEETSRGGVVLFFAARGAGVQKGRVTLANALAERGIDITCVVPQAKGPFLEHLSSDVRVVEFGTRHAIPLVRRFARYLQQHRPRPFSLRSSTPSWRRSGRATWRASRPV